MKVTKIPKVLFFGSGKAGVKIFDYLIDSRIYVVAAVPISSDNGMKYLQYSLKRNAEKRFCKIYETTNPNSNDSIKFFSSLEFDYIISILYDKILHKKLLSMAKILSMNLHFSALPYFKGSYPIHWAIIKGGKSGVSLHAMNENIDSGDTFFVEEINIDSKETGYEIYQKNTSLGINRFKKIIPKIFAGTALTDKQNISISSYYSKSEPFNRTINWNWRYEDIDRFIRAFTYPDLRNARTFIDSNQIEILHPIFRRNCGNISKKNGTLINISQTNTLEIVCGDSLVVVPHYRYEINEKKYLTSNIEVINYLGLSVGSFFKSVNKDI